MRWTSFFLLHPPSKALLNLPATDSTLLLYILPEKLQTDVRASLCSVCAVLT